MLRTEAWGQNHARRNHLNILRRARRSRAWAELGQAELGWAGLSWIEPS